MSYLVVMTDDRYEVQQRSRRKDEEEKFIDKFERDNEVKLKKIEIDKSVTEII